MVISDEILDVFNFSSISIFSNLSAANVFSCEMQVGEENTCQPPKKKKPTKMNQQLTLPAGSCHGPEEEAPVQRTRFLQKKHSGQHGGGWRQESGHGERWDTGFEDKLWVEDFCGDGVEFFLSPYARM